MCVTFHKEGLTCLDYSFYYKRTSVLGLNNYDLIDLVIAFGCDERLRGKLQNYKLKDDDDVHKRSQIGSSSSTDGKTKNIRNCMAKIMNI